MKAFFQQLGAHGILLAIIFVLIVGGIGDALLERFVFPHLKFFDNKAPIVINRREEVQINDGLNNAEIINRVKNSLPAVYLHTGGFGTARFRPVSVFSGVIAASDGIIAVPAASLRTSLEITVVLADGRNFAASILAADNLTGLAFLKISAEGLPVVNQGVSADLKTGEKILAIWNRESPLDAAAEPLTVTAVTGPASGFANIYNTAHIDGFLSVSGAKTPGAVVVNRNSTLVGFITQIGRDTVVLRAEHFSLAVAKLLADQKISWVDPKFSYLALGEVQTKILGLSKRTGVLFSGDRGLLKDGDFIYAVDGFELTNPREFQERVLAKKPGDKLKLKLIRADQEIEVEIVL